MRPQTALTQTLYAQLQEEASALAVLTLDEAVLGSWYVQRVAERDYLYWQVKQADGSLKRTSLGRDSPELRAHVKQLLARKQSTREAIDALKVLTKTYLASGGSSVEPAHFKVIEVLARGGLFGKGVVLVGSHAFAAIGSMLGVTWGSALKTSDMDFARPSGIALAIPDSGERINVPEIARSSDPSFFEVPRLDRHAPSTAMISRKTRVKIDFLTAQRGHEDTKPHVYPDLAIAAEPLRFMDYLLGGSSHRGLVIGTYAIPVNLPDPARFAVHKLVIAQERSVASATKVEKDIRQAGEVIEALAERGRDHDLREALRELLDAHGNSALERLAKSTLRLDTEPQRIVGEQRAAVESCGGR